MTTVILLQKSDLGSVFTNDNSAASGGIGIVSASTTVAGKIQIATSAQVTTGTDNTTAITPSTLSSAVVAERTATATLTGKTLDGGSNTFTNIPSSALAATAVTANSYGSATKVGTFTVNSKGQITVAADVTIGILSSQVTDSGTANGVATLDGTGKLLTAQIPSSLVGALQYQGVWNASTNSPALATGTGTKGQYYVVSTAGTTTIDGVSLWAVGDWLVYNGTKWDKVVGSVVSSFSGITITGLTGYMYANGTGLVTASTTIPNAGLANSSVTIGSTAVSLGGTAATIAGLTLTTPNLGTPTALVLTNATGLPLSTGVTGTLPIANGGTNSSTAAGARTNLGAAASGANSDITNLTGLTGGLTLSGAASPLTLNASVGTAGQYLASAGAGATPVWTTLSAASTTVAGIARYATNAEVVTGTDAASTITPAALTNKLSVTLLANDGVTVLGHLAA